MTKQRIKIRIKKTRKQRAPHRPTKVHRDKTKYTRKGRIQNRRRRALLRELEKEKDK